MSLPPIRIFGVRRLPPSARKPRLIQAICRKTLKNERAKIAGEINIIFLDRKKMRALNKRHLNHGHDTDVIAFNHDAPPVKIADLPFGDIYVSAYQARAQAADMGHSVLVEVLTLVVHGTLHLLGYDDSTAKKKAVMFRRQDLVLSSVRG